MSGRNSTQNAGRLGVTVAPLSGTDWNAGETSAESTALSFLVIQLGSRTVGVDVDVSWANLPI